MRGYYVVHDLDKL